MDQASGHGFRVSRRLQSGCRPGQGSSAATAGQGPASKLILVGQDSFPCGLLFLGPRFLAGCWPEATLRSLTCEPLYMAACFIRASKEEN